MKNWALLGVIVAIGASISLMIAPLSTAISPFDTEKRIGEFGENVEIFLSSHSEDVKDREIVNAEHKIMRLEQKAEKAKQQADDAEEKAMNNEDPKKQAGLDRTAERLAARVAPAFDKLCTEIDVQQQKLADNGKSSAIIDAIEAEHCS